MSETLSPSLSNINPEHRSFKAAESLINRPREIVFGAPSPDLARDVNLAMEIFPPHMRVKLKESVPTFHAAVFATKKADSAEKPVDTEQAEKKPTVGLFFLSGVPGSGAGHLFVPLEMVRAAQSRPELGEVTLGGSVGAVLSADTNGSRLVTNPVERAGYLAAFFEEMMKNQNCDEIYLIGHSLGAAELPYLVPLLNKLFEIRGKKTRVAGAIMHQPGGMGDQRMGGLTGEKGVLSFAIGRTGRVSSFIDDTAYMFPTRDDFARIETEIGMAQDKGDHTLAMRLEAVKKDMLEQPAKNQHFIDNNLEQKQKDELAKIDSELESAYSLGDSKKADKYYQQRLKLLSPMVIKIVNTREKTPKDPSPLAFAKFAPYMLLHPAGLLGMVPAEVRKLMKVPIAVTSSDADLYFPKKLVTSSFDTEQIRQYEKIKAAKIAQGTGEEGLNDEAFAESRMFPESPETFLVDIPNLPHSGTTVDPEKVAPMAIDMFVRMKESVRKSGKGVLTRLGYFGKFGS